MAKKKFSKSNVLWFIRTRSYTPVADLRRRFRLDPEEVTTLREPSGRIYIGLPEREANMIHQLWLEGKVGLQCLPRMHARVVEGVYPLQGEQREAAAAEIGLVEAGAGETEEEQDQEDARAWG